MISASTVNVLTSLSKAHPEVLASSASLTSGFAHSPLESFQHARPPLRWVPEQDVHQLSPFGHLRGCNPLFCDSPSSTFLHPLAPQALPCFHATMDALTPARLALRTLIRGNEHQPFTGQVSLVHKTRTSLHSVTNHPAHPAVASMLPTQRNRLPEFEDSGLDFTIGMKARRYVRPKRVRFTTDCRFASGCSPPHLTVTQLPSATGNGHFPEEDFHLPDRACSQAHIPPAKPEA